MKDPGFEPSISGDVDLADDERLQPLHDLMLVRRYDGDTTAAGGLLIIPDKAREPSCHGTVLAAGPGRKLDSGEREPMECGVGDTVMYDGSTGINAREYRKGSGIIVVAQRDVLFVANEDMTGHDADRFEPGGDRYAQPDEDGWWPIGKDLPQWLRARVEEAKAGDVEIVKDDSRSNW